ncbi:discoidin domain-containing protein [Alteromonas stellipolaris]|uniref:discoidin domain-containing protein n=1 Tax=Alteromonas stellipolaris TaxID=233316 RepID=UPI001D6CCC74|nr:discoidin domain-containing protein [Alteromonas stellipolaris]MBZ2163627.1 LicD family protein [Alteromonas stellipolaris]
MIKLFKSKQVNETEAKSLEHLLPSSVLAELKQHIANNPLREFKGAKSKDPLIIQTDRKARFVRLSLQTEVSFHLDGIEIFNKDGRNIAPNKKTIISSTYNNEEKYDGRGFVNSKMNGGCGFHTQRERNPWLIIDLMTIRNLDRIVVYNREGEFYTRALSLKVEVSQDLHTWHPVFDNWSVLKSFHGKAPSDVEKAVLHAMILDPGPSQQLLTKLKKEGRHEQALEYQSCVNELLKDRGLALGPHGLMRTFELQSASEKRKVASELGLILKWLNDEFGVPAFISSGTLLGIVRDGQFIAHDDDVDICYISKESSEDGILEERQRIVTFLQSKKCNVKGSGIAHLWCTTPGGQNLDIFTGFVEDEFCSMNPISRREIKTSDVLPLTTLVHDGVALYLPANPERLLEVNYGKGWRHPDPLWSFNWGKAKSDFAFLYFG